MSSDRAEDATIGVTAFRAQCSALIDAVAQGKIKRVILTKQNRAVAAIVPIEHDLPELWGAMRGSVRVVPGADLTQPVSEGWKAEN